MTPSVEPDLDGEMRPDYQPPTPFLCAQCGNCCRGEGYVRITAAESEKIAQHLGLTIAEFADMYTRQPEISSQSGHGDLWLLDKPGPEMECIFLEDNRCRIHEAKPVQCIGFPLKWRTPDIMDYCEGMKR